MRGVEIAVVVVVLAACVARASAQDPPTSVSLIVMGDGEPVRSIRRALARERDLPVGLQLRELPRELGGSESGAEAETVASLATARTQYIVEADFDRCLAVLEGDERIASLLGRGSRELAARVLFWRTACHVGAGDVESARRAARALAVHGLSVPPDVEAGNPEVEAILAEALREAGAAPRAPLHVTSRPEGTVRVDASEPSCTTPCTPEVAVGDHVVSVDAPGFVPASRSVRVPAEGASTSLMLTPASPELAASQWRARFAAARAVDSTESVSLLARAIRARRLVVLSALEEGDGARVRGALSIDGRVRARAERGPDAGSAADAAAELVYELLVEGRVMERAPSVWASPWLWVGIVIAAAGAAALTAALLYDPGTQTRLEWAL